MLVAASTGEVVFAVLVPIVSALIGATGGALVARYIRRGQLYSEAALRIESYVVKANDLLDGVASGFPFDADLFNRVLQQLSLARFHNKRLDSEELDERLSAAQAVATDILIYEDLGGLPHLKKAISNAMEVVIVYMKIPPLLPWRKRTFPKSYFPKREEYRELVEETGTGEESGTSRKLDYTKLRSWENERDRELLQGK